MFEKYTKHAIGRMTHYTKTQLKPYREIFVGNSFVKSTLWVIFHNMKNKGLELDKNYDKQNSSFLDITSCLVFAAIGN